MSDLPILPQTPLRSAKPFTDIDRLAGRNFQSAWVRSDVLLAQLEDAEQLTRGRERLKEISPASICGLHRDIFQRDGAGQLRERPMRPIFRGQDCPAPEFIHASLDNFCSWLSADSIREIHAVEQAALVIIRVLDIWPFEFGNKTVALILGNHFLSRQGFAPFSFEARHVDEFNMVLAQAITIDTQPLVQAIHSCLKREMEALAGK